MAVIDEVSNISVSGINAWLVVAEIAGFPDGSLGGGMEPAVDGLAGSKLFQSGPSKYIPAL